MDALFYEVCFGTSRLVTSTYSTSFSIGTRCLHPDIRDGIYSIYGFVRFADEIVDSFHGYNKEQLLEEFESEYYRSLEKKISMNPIINSFQHTVRKYRIGDELVFAFFKSMKSDLYNLTFTDKELEEYIYGSAEVVGLMCLRVFVNGKQEEYDKLKPYAMRLGAAFQKINFLRDIRHDTKNLNRTYFPMLENRPLDEAIKKKILDEIMEDYRFAAEGIKQLPEKARLGVYTAYLYYRSLTEQIRRTPAKRLMKKRIRVSNMQKMTLFYKAYLQTKFM